MKERRLTEYIDMVISDACAVEKRPNDVKYQFRIIGNHLLFALSSKYRRVRMRVEYRLLKNTYKNFQYHFHLVLPDPIQENDACAEAAAFDLYPLDEGVDPNFCVDRWDVFGKKYTIRAFTAVYPLEGGEPHLTKLKEQGYDYLVDNDWEKFQAAFFAVYGVTPLQMVKPDM